MRALPVGPAAVLVLLLTPIAPRREPFKNVDAVRALKSTLIAGLRVDVPFKARSRQ